MSCATSSTPPPKTPFPEAEPQGLISLARLARAVSISTARLTRAGSISTARLTRAGSISTARLARAGQLLHRLTAGGRCIQMFDAGTHRPVGRMHIKGGKTQQAL